MCMVAKSLTNRFCIDFFFAAMEQKKESTETGILRSCQRTVSLWWSTACTTLAEIFPQTQPCGYTYFFFILDENLSWLHIISKKKYSFNSSITFFHRVRKFSLVFSYIVNIRIERYLCPEKITYNFNGIYIIIRISANEFVSNVDITVNIILILVSF